MIIPLFLLWPKFYWKHLGFLNFGQYSIMMTLEVVSEEFRGWCSIGDFWRKLDSLQTLFPKPKLPHTRTWSYTQVFEYMFNNLHTFTHTTLNFHLAVLLELLTKVDNT